LSAKFTSCSKWPEWSKYSTLSTNTTVTVHFQCTTNHHQLHHESNCHYRLFNTYLIPHSVKSVP
jgi:hypothetical protein